MAMTVTTKTLHDGVRNCSMQFTGVGDGSGDENLVPKVDVSELSPPAAKVKIDKITYDVGYGLVRLFWDAGPGPKEFLVLINSGIIDYCHIGGMVNREANSNGDIYFSTEAFEANSAYTVLLDMVKKGVG